MTLHPLLDTRALSGKEPPTIMNHLLSLEKMDTADFHRVFALAHALKQERGAHTAQPLKGQTWALIFSKSSTRTRVSFEVGIRELGGESLFLSANDIQLGRGEPIEDTARVLGRMVHGAVIRTFAQSDVEQFARFGGIPTINALTDDEHPCQILTDLFTFGEILNARGQSGTVEELVKGKTIVFVGDAACNVPVSWIFAAARLGFELRLAAPRKYQPSGEILARAHKLCVPGAKIILTENLDEAVHGADLLYTDVWVSMGKEAEAQERIQDLSGYQINEPLLTRTGKDTVIMHCLPAYRGKEISADCFEKHAGTIFDQAENRLHVQKAILSLMKKEA